MKIYQTNSGLGYKQYVYLIRLGKKENGYNYLCIGTHNVDEDNGFFKHSYRIGEIIKEYDECYLELEDTNFKITDSELYGTFLFDFFINNYNFEQ